MIDDYDDMVIRALVGVGPLCEVWDAIMIKKAVNFFLEGALDEDKITVQHKADI